MFNPPITPVDLHGAYDDLSRLLAILADPAAHRQRLDELVAQENTTKAEIATLNAMAAETRRLHSTAQATNIVSDNRKTALDAREAEIEQRTNQLELAESARSEAALRRRENAVQAREEAAAREAERLAAIRKDYEARLGKIKNLTATLER